MKNPLKITLALLVVTLCLDSVAVAGPVDDAVAAYERGDYAPALGLLRPLAEQRDFRAQNSLGNLCVAGKGVPRDYVQAHLWSNLAAANYPPEASEYRQDAVMNRGLAAKELTKAQIAEAEQLAREWKPKAQNAGN